MVNWIVICINIFYLFGIYNYLKYVFLLEIDVVEVDLVMNVVIY